MSTSTETAPVTLPTEDELKAVAETLADALDALSDVYWPVRHIARHWGAGSGFDPRDPDAEEQAAREIEVPTYESIGRLFSFGDLFRSYLNEMSDYVRCFEDQNLRSLDIVRAERGSDA